MQADELPTGAFEIPPPGVALSDFPESPEVGQEVSPSFIDPLELEALALILEHSLKVHTAHHFYCWTQGLLQNLIHHELLICGIRNSESSAFHVDSFSSSASEPGVIRHLFSHDTVLVPRLLKAWEENHFQPLFFDMNQDAATLDSSLGREFSRMGSSELLVHGTYDNFGRTVSFFIFASLPGSISNRQCHLAALLIPSLHAAWVHTQYTRPILSGQTGVQAGSNDLLTAREQEILGWIYQGKSNIEIGMILNISPLTVKNHVQKILRRLNVLNRAQAVGKALALRILDGSIQR